MLRWIVRILMVLLLLLSAVSVMMWVRSYSVDDVLYYRSRSNFVEVDSMGGMLRVFRMSTRGMAISEASLGWELVREPSAWGIELQTFGIQVDADKTWEVVVPWYLIFLLAAFLPVWLAVRVGCQRSVVCRRIMLAVGVVGLMGLAFRLLQAEVSDYWGFSMHWVPLLIWLVVVTLLNVAVSRRRLAGAGVCVACGYDLRGSTGACPECGVMPSEADEPHFQGPQGG